MEERKTLHNYAKILNGSIKRLEDNTKISRKNKETIKRFRTALTNKGVGDARLCRVMEQMRRIAEWLGKDFETADRADIERIVSEIHSVPTYAFKTIEGYTVQIKQFYKWFQGNDEEYPAMVRWIRGGINANRKERLPTELITEEDVEKILKACAHPRDRAFISLLWETGARISEIGTAQIKALSFNDGEGQLVVQGKTGWRKVLLISSVPYLKEWLKYHTHADDKNAPIFTLIYGTKNGLPITYAAIVKTLRVVMKAAGVNKPTNPHLWRHSRATYLANHLTEAQLCGVLGWVVGSKEARTYVHLSGKETNESIRRLYGRETKTETKKESVLTPRKCEICGEANEPAREICQKCNNPLSIKGAVEKSIRSQGLEERLACIEEVLRIMGAPFDRLFEEKITDRDLKAIREKVFVQTKKAVGR